MTRDVASVLTNLLGDSWRGEQAGRVVRTALRFAEHPMHRVDAPPALLAQFQHVLDDPDAQQFLQFNEHEGVLYLNREQLEHLVQAFGDIRAPAFEGLHHIEAQRVALEDEHADVHDLLETAGEGGYRVERLREFLESRAADVEI